MYPTNIPNKNAPILLFLIFYIYFMAAKSRQQLKYIFAMRKKYKSKKNAPKDKKWVFNDEWTKGVDTGGMPTKVKDFKTFSVD
jgi:hypothetical protein